MGLIIKSPVKELPGELVVSDPLTYPQLIEWREKLSEFIAKAAMKDTDYLKSEYEFAWPAIFAVAEKITIKGFESMNVEQIPSAPRKPIDKLLAHLITELRVYIRGEESIPKD